MSVSPSPGTSPHSPAPPPAISLVRRLLGLSWRYRWGVALLLLLQAAVVALTIVGLALLGWGIDYIRGGGVPPGGAGLFPFSAAELSSLPQNRVLLLVGGGIFAAAFLRGLTSYVQAWFAGVLIHCRIIVDLRSEVYVQLQRLSFSYYDRTNSGAVINRVTSDVQSVRLFVDGVLMQIIQAVFSLGAYLFYMVRLDPLLTLVCLATTPLLAGLSLTFSRRVRPAYEIQRDLTDRMTLRLTENVQGMLVVKGFGQEEAEQSRFASASAAVGDGQAKIFGWIGNFTPSIGFLTQVNLAVLLGWGGMLVVAGKLPLGTGLVVFAGLLQQFSAQVTGISGIANSIQQSLAGARRVFEVLDLKPDVRNPAVPVRPAPFRGALALRNVTFGYDADRPVLHDVSLEVAPGECVAIVGATGAGKSSLLALLPRFYDPQAGTILLDGHDLRTLDLTDLRGAVGLVFQDGFLFGNTVRDNIAFGRPQADLAAIETAAKQAAADEFIRGLPRDYDTVLGEAGVDLSGGQRQRLALARALLLDPAVLLLDGPTSAVDPETEQEILDAIDAVRAGRTTLIVAHRLASLRRADRIVVLAAGRIVQQGTHADLMQQDGPYRDMARLQMGTAGGTPSA